MNTNIFGANSENFIDKTQKIGYCFYKRIICTRSSKSFYTNRVMSEGRRSKLSSTSVLHKSSAKRICDDEDEEERSSPKKFRSDPVGFGYLGDGEGTPVAAGAHEKKVPAKRGRKKKNHNPTLLHEYRGGADSPGGEGNSLASPRPSSSGTSLVEAPCKSPEKRVHFHPESVADDMDAEVKTSPGTVRGASSRDQGVQVKLGEDSGRGTVTPVANRGVQTVESSWNVRGVAAGHLTADAQAGRKPVDLVPEARINQMAAGSDQRKEPEASGSQTSGLQGVKQQVPEAGEVVDAGSGSRPQSCDARRGATTSSTRIIKEMTIFEDHSHVHLELVIEFLLLCFVMWFFKYR